jgi:ribonuclease HI
MTGLRV